MSVIVGPIADHLRKRQERTLAVTEAQNTLVVAEGARVALSQPIMKEHFIQGALDCYLQFLNAKTDADRLLAQVRAVQLNELYDRLTVAISRGEQAAQRLDELAQQQQNEEETHG